jgi:hypothetical protein
MIGYEMLTLETVDDLQARKEGCKYIIALASTMD